jgi:hypothetical protein
MEKGLCYEPLDETIDSIAWDWVDNHYIDNLGNCYKTLDDIPSNLLRFVVGKKTI